jgi:hypothetical protein
MTTTADRELIPLRDSCAIVAQMKEEWQPINDQLRSVLLRTGKLVDVIPSPELRSLVEGMHFVCDSHARGLVMELKRLSLVLNDAARARDAKTEGESIPA